MNKVSLKVRMYVEALRQQKLNAVITMIILGLQLLIVTFAAWDTGRHGPYEGEFELLEVQPLLILVPSVILATMLYAQFSWMNKRSESDFYHSIPIKRIWLLIVDVAAAITLSVAIFWGFALAARIIIPIAGQGTIKIVFGDLFKYFMISFTMGMMVSGAMMVGRGLAGKMGPANLLALILIYGPRMILWSFKLIMEEIAPYISIKDGLIWDNRYNLMFFYGITDKGWGPILYSLALCLVYWIVGTILFVKRRSEIAEKIAANTKIQLFIRLFLAFVVSIFANALVLDKIMHNGGDDDFDVIIFALYVIAFATYFLYELITTKKLRSLKKAAPGALILIGLDLAMILGCFGYISYHKNAKITPDNIESISLTYKVQSYDEGYRVFAEAYNGKPINDEAVKREFVDMLEKVKEHESYGYRDVEYKVTTTNGTYYRRISLSLRDILSITKDKEFLSQMNLRYFVDPNRIDRTKTSSESYSKYLEFYNLAKEMTDEEFADWYLKAFIDGDYNYVYMHDYKRNGIEYYIPKLGENDYYEYDSYELKREKKKWHY